MKQQGNIKADRIAQALSVNNADETESIITVHTIVHIANLAASELKSI